MLLAAAERRLELADRLAAAIHAPRDVRRVRLVMADILRARILAIACGYEDANDLDRLRTDPAFTLACGRLPDSGAYARSRHVRGWRTCRTSRASSGSVMCWSICGCRAMPRRPRR